MKAKALKTCKVACNDYAGTTLDLEKGKEVDLEGLNLSVVDRLVKKGMIEEPASDKPAKKAAKKASKKPGRTEDKAADGATEDK